MPSKRTTPVKVLVVDDSLAELQFVRDTLSQHGYEVHIATDPEVLREHMPDAEIVLIDYHMPGTNGREVLAQMRAMVRPPARPFFYLYTSDRALGGVYRDFGFDGQFIMKGNADALIRQIDAARRAVTLRRMRPGA